MFTRYQTLLPLSKKKLVNDKLDAFDAFVKDRYDAIVVGSDVVWGIDPNHFPSPYWLHNQKCKKLSYAAASHGTDYNFLSSNIRKYCSESLNDFDYIGVRDKSTELFVKSITSHNVVHHNCDPTLLLDMSDIPADMNHLQKKIKKLPGYDSNKKTIGLMMSDPYITSLLKNSFGKEYNIIAIYTSNPLLKCCLYDIDVFEWANIFSLFSVTVTTFFHGTLFSLKNNTPVISVNIKKQDEKYMGKTEDILTRLGMKDCFFHKSYIQQNEKQFVDKIHEQINNDSNRIEIALNKERQYYYGFYKAMTQIII